MLCSSLSSIAFFSLSRFARCLHIYRAGNSEKMMQAAYSQIYKLKDVDGGEKK